MACARTLKGGRVGSKRVLFIAAQVILAGCKAANSSVDSAALRPAGDTLRVPILVYHSVAEHHAGQNGEQRELDVDTAVFRRQMAYIAAKRHPVIPLSALVESLDRHGTVPANAVVITFDDGWLNQYEFAFPILRQYGFTATFFVYTKGIGLGPAFMTWDDVRALQHAGMTIGAHSRTHPDLTKKGVSLANEISGSRQDITSNVGMVPVLFAYPYGAWNDAVADAVRAAGFLGARGMGDGPRNTPANRFALHSIQATDDMQAFEDAIDGTTIENAANRSNDSHRPTRHAR